MSSQQLRALLQGAREGAPGEQREALAQWKSDVDALVRTLEAWALEVDPRALTYRGEETLTEAEAGTYTVANLTVQWEGVPGEVRVRPYGMTVRRVKLLSGDYSAPIDGVVRMSFGADRRSLCRRRGATQASWLLSTSASPALHPLDLDSYAAVIIELLGPALRRS
jgi:hypothetical protein